MKQKGFTLIELMIVVAIIGILAAVAIPQYQNYVARAQVSEAFSLASGAKTGVAEYAMVKGEFPTSNELAGIDAMSGKYVDTVEVGAGGKITATFGAGAHTNLIGGELFLTPGGLDSGSITWTCSGPDITTYLPSSCDAELASSDISVASAKVASGLEAESPPVMKSKPGTKWDPGNMLAEDTACWDVADLQWEAGTNGCAAGYGIDVEQIAMCQSSSRNCAEGGVSGRVIGQCMSYRRVDGLTSWREQARCQ